MEKPEIQVKANYSFWKNPIKWVKDYRMRKIMTSIVNYQWENEMKEKIHAMVFHANAYGHTQEIKKDSDILTCNICNETI